MLKNKSVDIFSIGGMGVYTEEWSSQVTIFENSKDENKKKLDLYANMNFGVHKTPVFCIRVSDHIFRLYSFGTSVERSDEFSISG